MTTITLPEDVSDRLALEASRRGTTPELLALDALRRLFAPAALERKVVAGNSLFDFLSAYLDTVDGTAEALSENCGRRFAEGLADKQRQGRL